MTIYGFYRLYGEKKRIFLLNRLTTTHYAIILSQYSQNSTKNLPPTSCRESLDSLESPDSVYHKAGFDKIRGISKSLIATDTRAIFKEKYEGDRAIAGESKVLPQLIQRGFEGVWCYFPLASETKVRNPLKASDNECLMGMCTDQGAEKRNDINEVMIKTYSKEGVRKDRLCVYITKA